VKQYVLMSSGIVKALEGSSKFNYIVNWLFIKIKNNDATPFASLMSQFTSLPILSQRTFLFSLSQDQ